MRNYLALIVCIFIFPFRSYTEIITVPEDYASIQNAIDSCAAGDTILLAPANYQESLQINQKSLVLASYFLSNPDSNYISSTILTGDPIISVSYCSDTVKVIGITLEGGGSNKGAGMNITYSNVVVRDNHFVFNDNGHWQTAQGGGVYAFTSSLDLINNRFEYNQSDYGGALYAIECQLQLGETCSDITAFRKQAGRSLSDKVPSISNKTCFSRTGH